MEEKFSFQTNQAPPYLRQPMARGTPGCVAPPVSSNVTLNRLCLPLAGSGPHRAVPTGVCPKLQSQAEAQPAAWVLTVLCLSHASGSLQGPPWWAGAPPRGEAPGLAWPVEGVQEGPRSGVTPEAWAWPGPSAGPCVWPWTVVPWFSSHRRDTCRLWVPTSELFPGW